MANFKHKVFLLIAKWIPVAVAAGILINNTLAILDVKDVILDLFDITVGSSLAFVIMMYACSYVFNFCYWHKIVITYDLFVLLYILLIRYTNIGECSDGLLLTIHYILAGIFIPHGRKRLGFNELSWVLKDLDEAKRYLANNND